MMKGMALRGRGAAGQVAGWIAGNLLKMAALLVAVSVVAFTLVTLSPVDPVQQYLTGVRRAARRFGGILGVGSTAGAAFFHLGGERVARGFGNFDDLSPAGDTGDW